MAVARAAGVLLALRCKNLEVLDLDWTGAGVDTVAVLAQSAALGALRRLVLARPVFKNWERQDG